MFNISLFLLFACDEKKSEEAQSEKTGWDAYVPTVPTEEMNSWLVDSNVMMPDQKCVPYDESMNVQEEDIILDDAGNKQVCFWNHVSGAVPEGEVFGTLTTCESVWTQGPSWFIPPEPLFESDTSLEQDSEYMKELDWVRAQGHSSGCSCCHSSESAGYATKWDYDAPGIWTDTLPMSGIVMAAGLAEEHAFFGYWAPEDNFGFDRAHTLIPTTDIERMKAFFLKEFERRGGTQEDIEEAAEAFITVNFQLFEEPSECILPFEGIDENGSVVWNGPEARQVYIQELGSENPGFLPNFDLPEGTVWALYAKDFEAGFQTGELQPGVTPLNGTVMIPEDGSSPVLESGKQYRLFVTPDIMVLRHANCVFTMP